MHQLCHLRTRSRTASISHWMRLSGRSPRLINSSCLVFSVLWLAGPTGYGEECLVGVVLVRSMQMAWDVSLWAEHDLTITNTLFQLKNKHKTSWMHPRSKHWHLIDYIIVRCSNISNVLITCAVRGAEGSWNTKVCRQKWHAEPLQLCKKTFMVQ